MISLFVLGQSTNSFFPKVIDCRHGWDGYDYCFGLVGSFWGDRVTDVYRNGFQFRGKTHTVERAEDIGDLVEENVLNMFTVREEGLELVEGLFEKPVFASQLSSTRLEDE